MSSGIDSSQVQPASPWTTLPIRVGPDFSQPMPFQASAHSLLTPPDTLGPTNQAWPPPCPIITSDQVHALSQIHASSQIAAEPPVSDIPLISPPSTTSTQDQSSHPMTTRSRNHISKPKSFTDGTMKYPLPHALLADGIDVNISAEPTCYTSAMKDPKWRAIMNLEFDALLKNQTWELVPSHLAWNIVGCKWVFRIKRLADGSVERYKARLVAKGFHQVPGVDYGETFNPVIKPTTVRIVLSLAVSKGWVLRQFDVQNAFLHGNLYEDVYMSQPLRFSHPQFPNHVCKLKKALYGLKQSPRAWFSRLSSRLIALGFHGSQSDSSLFIYHSPVVTIYFLIYVDDLIVTASQPSAIDTLLRHLQLDFAIKDLGNLNFFLGLEVLPTTNGLLLSQKRYILDLSSKTKMLDAKPLSSPMASSTSLSAFEGDPLPNATLYRSTVEALQYLSLTSPDITFTVNKLSQFMHRPTSIHW